MARMDGPIPVHWWLKEGFRCVLFYFSGPIGIGWKKVEGTEREISASSPDRCFPEGHQGCLVVDLVYIFSSMP
jgi:hypothetical protein